MVTMPPPTLARRASGGRIPPLRLGSP